MSKREKKLCLYGAAMFGLGVIFGSIITRIKND